MNLHVRLIFFSPRWPVKERKSIEPGLVERAREYPLKGVWLAAVFLFLGG